jgi:hypothetical protein
VSICWKSSPALKNDIKESNMFYKTGEKSCELASTWSHSMSDV